MGIIFIGRRLKRYLTSIYLLCQICLMASPVFAQAFIQSYGTDSPIDEGMIVEVMPNSPDKVEPVKKSDQIKTLGVVVDSRDAPIAFSSTSNTTQVFVATAGKFNILVSDQNGNINTGDYIVVSSLSGVGMKVDTVSPIVVGQALSSFNGGSNQVGTAQVETSGGAKTIHLGIIQANIGVAHNPLQQTNINDVPSFLRKATSGITGGKVVSPWRLYLSAILFLVTAIVTSVFVYSGVRNSIISLGRNPLSKNTIMRGLVTVILTGVIIFITGLFTVYLLLKL